MIADPESEVIEAFKSGGWATLNEENLSTIIGYYNGDVLVAFSMIAEYNEHNAECYQFAWDYVNPKLQLGIRSLKNECAMYKEMGYSPYTVKLRGISAYNINI